jgi:hypothetical protein
MSFNINQQIKSQFYEYNLDRRREIRKILKLTETVLASDTQLKNTPTNGNMLLNKYKYHDLFRQTEYHQRGFRFLRRSV